MNAKLPTDRRSRRSRIKSNGEKRLKRSTGASATDGPVSDLPASPKQSGPRAPKRFPIVGVGASAGGLDAFTLLLRSLPLDTGMAFVLVQHLDPDHQSALTYLLARTTAMPVTEVTHGMAVAPNRVYVIPPNTNMVISGGVLKLQPRQKTAGAHRSIDFFFESLAQDQKEMAIGVVLSGTATDGTQGLEMIKSEGGLTFAQDASAKYDSMPRSAVAAGCVDLELSPEEIGKELAKISKHPLVAASPTASRRAKSPPRAKMPAEPGAGPDQPNSPNDERALKSILLALRNHRGVDFSVYKPNTIHRRIARRMVLKQMRTLTDYAAHLDGNHQEIDLLYSDVLISVTSFFRNPEAFATLKEKVFPELLRQHQQEDPVRVWTLGCSTGQEAYSIAMAYTEFCDKIPRAPKLQIFATDLNEAMLEKARRGLYAKSLVGEISPERLKRFFVDEQAGYHICKSIRDLCVFARQNVLTDPPFSRMDLISCRNLMIYVELDLQKKLLPNFHYALKPGGFLFLGASESIGAFTHLFEPVDKKQKIFSKKPGIAPLYHSPVASEPAVGIKKISGERPTSAREIYGVKPHAEREADRVLVGRYAPPSVVIDDRLEVLQFRGQIEAFLAPAAGKASFNLLKMARPRLLAPLRAAINAAKSQDKAQNRQNVRLDDSPEGRTANIEVIPIRNVDERCFLILFEETSQTSIAKDKSAPARPPPLSPKKMESANARRVRDLETELAENRDYVHSLQEKHTSATDELQASHEEVQSANEELQSIVEELETSKEELESTNEELTTVNEEMASRNLELSRLNGDLTNFQSSTHLPIILLGPDLSIRRFNPAAEKVFNLLPADIGRPIGNVRHNLDVPDLEKIVANVIATGREHKSELRDKAGHWHLLQVRPYLTRENAADGAVLVLVDIHALKESEQAVIAARDFAEAIIRTARDPFLILDANLRVERANDAFYDTFKVSAGDSIGRSVFELDHGHWDIPKLRELIENILPRRSFFNNFEVTHNFENIGQRTMLLNARTLSETTGQPKRILLGIQDITELLHFQNQMRRSELRYRRLFEASRDGVLVMYPETRKILDANPFMSELLGYPLQALLGKELFEIGLLKDAESSIEAFEELRRRGFIRYDNLPLETARGERREVEFVSNLYHEGELKVVQCNIRDITDRKKSEQQLAEKARLLDLSNDAIIVRGIDDKITLWNRGAEKLYGWTAEEAMGKHMHTLLQTEFPKPMEQIVAQLYADGHYTGELIQIARDGRRVPSLCRCVLDTATESILTSYTDISERKRMEDELRQSEERYRSLFNSMDEGFCVVEMLYDTAGNPVDYLFLEVNPSFVKQAGREMLGRRMLEIAPTHEAYWFETYGAVVTTGTPVRFINEAKALNAWFDVYAFRVGQQADRKVAVLFRNITERVDGEKELKRAHAQLADRAGQLERAVGERTSELSATLKQLEAFVYSIAHDLRAPLRSMQGFSEMLVEEAGANLSETGRDYARRISSSAQYMDALLMDLLTFSGIAQQRVELASVDLEPVIRMVASCLAREIHDSKARVEIEGPWPAVLAHEGTLGPVLVNLVGNALKFVNPGGAALVRVRAEDRGALLRVWVEDNGIGIAPEHQEQIFKLFTRLNGDKYAGTGIGLAIVQKGIERMSGKTGVESTLGHGSRFWFDLPKTNHL